MVGAVYFFRLTEVIDNCMLKGQQSISAGSSKLQKVLLQHEHGEAMLNLAGFFLSEANVDDSVTAEYGPNKALTKEAAEKARHARRFLFDSTKTLQAQTTRACIGYCLEIARQRGVTRMLRFDPGILVPDGIHVFLFG